MNVRPGWTPEFVLSVLHYAILPALSLVLVGIGTWFLGMRALVSNIVTEDYVTYAELAGVRRPTILFGYVIRNAMIPQLTSLAMTLGLIFSGTIIVEQVFSYPGLGSLLVRAVVEGDTLGCACGLIDRDHRGGNSDLHHRPHPSDPRSAREGGIRSCSALSRDLFRYNIEFAIGIVFVGLIVVFGFLHFLAPVDPSLVYAAPMDVAPNAPVLVRHQFARARTCSGNCRPPSGTP